MPNRIRVLALTILMLTIWVVLGMAYADQFPAPFDRLERWLMPWKQMYTNPPQGSTDRRLFQMQELLEASNRVAQYSFTLLIISFAALSAYLSVVYQQKYRRARENMFLVLKNREIARRNEFIRYISATIGHEFKNNLGRIKRRIDLLPGLPKDDQDRIDENMEKLFADIEIFKKISDEREAGLVAFQNIDLKALLDEMASHVGDFADVIVHESVRLPMIYAAPPLLRTVFENVFDNAIKYKKPEQARAHILVTCAMDRDGNRRYATVSIWDEGIGMDEQQAVQCFYKGRGTGASWGQGLYFAKYVIGLHAGRIRVGKKHTGPGVGTEIIIYLPFVEEAQDV